MKEAELLKSYFELSDSAGKNVQDFEKLLALFSKDARIITNGQVVTDIRQFFRTFFDRNVELHHLFDASASQVDWVVAGRRSTGQLFALKGVDTAVFQNNKIIELSVKISESI